MINCETGDCLRWIFLLFLESYYFNELFLISEMNNSIIHDSLKYYFHDLCRFYAIVMVYIQDKDPKAWKLLCNSTEELNR